MDQKKEDRRDETGEGRLGKEEGEKYEIEMTERAQIEDAKKDDEKQTFNQAGDKDKEKLGRKTFEIEPAFEKMGDIEDERPGKGVEAERISREQIHEKSHKKGDGATNHRRVEEA